MKKSCIPLILALFFLVNCTEESVTEGPFKKTTSSDGTVAYCLNGSDECLSLFRRSSTDIVSKFTKGTSTLYTFEEQLGGSSRPTATVLERVANDTLINTKFLYTDKQYPTGFETYFQLKSSPESSRNVIRGELITSAIDSAWTVTVYNFNPMTKVQTLISVMSINVLPNTYEIVKFFDTVNGRAKTFTIARSEVSEMKFDIEFDAEDFIKSYAIAHAMQVASLNIIRTIVTVGAVAACINVAAPLVCLAALYIAHDLMVNQLSFTEDLAETKPVGDITENSPGSAIPNNPSKYLPEVVEDDIIRPSFASGEYPHIVDGYMPCTNGTTTMEAKIFVGFNSNKRFECRINVEMYEYCDYTNLTIYKFSAISNKVVRRNNEIIVAFELLKDPTKPDALFDPHLYGTFDQGLQTFTGTLSMTRYKDGAEHYRTVMPFVIDRIN